VRAAAATLAAVFLGLLGTSASAQPASPEERAAAVARPAIVLVKVSWHGWVRDKQTGEVFGGTAGYAATTSCTGVVINPDGYIATASHCVHTGPHGGGGILFDAALAELAKAGRVGDPAKARQALAERALAEGAQPDSPIDRAIQVERVVGAGTDHERDVAPAEVVDLVTPDGGDVAVLKISRDRLPALELRPDPPPVGTPVLAIGYPGSADLPVDPNLEPSNKNGQISAHRTLGERPFYEFSAAATHGMSGGPVVDSQGRVVGLISQGAPGQTQSFNFAAAVSTLTEVLERKGISASLGVHDRNYRGGLERYYAGDYDGAVAYLDAALAGAPTNLQAGALRRLAVEKGGVARASSTPLLSWIAIGCASLAVVAAALVTAMYLAGRARRMSTMDTPPLGFPMPVNPPAIAGSVPPAPPQLDPPP
jgi:serine protease Do